MRVAIARLSLFSILVVALLISLLLMETLFHRFSLFTLPVLATGIATFLLFTLTSNLLRGLAGLRRDFAPLQTVDRIPGLIC